MDLAPEPGLDRIGEVETALAAVFEDASTTARHERRREAQAVARGGDSLLDATDTHLVYGELDVRAVAKVLAAVDVRCGDRFIDIGSGDGLPTLAAALLYPEALSMCRGVEIVSGLVARAQHHERSLRAWLETSELRAASTEMICGDVYAPADDVVTALGESTLALCFATTWSHGAPRRELARLSGALHAHMPVGARAVIVDGRLLEREGWRWEGDLRIVTPDTAPYSTARLYVRI